VTARVQPAFLVARPKKWPPTVGEDAEGVYGEVHLKAGKAQEVKTIANFVIGLLALAKLKTQR